MMRSGSEESRGEEEEVDSTVAKNSGLAPGVGHKYSETCLGGIVVILVVELVLGSGVVWMLSVVGSG